MQSQKHSSLYWNYHNQFMQGVRGNITIFVKDVWLDFFTTSMYIHVYIHTHILVDTCAYMYYTCTYIITWKINTHSIIMQHWGTAPKSHNLTMHYIVFRLSQTSHQPSLCLFLFNNLLVSLLLFLKPTWSTGGLPISLSLTKNVTYILAGHNILQTCNGNTDGCVRNK